MDHNGMSEWPRRNAVLPSSSDSSPSKLIVERHLIITYSVESWFKWNVKCTRLACANGESIITSLMSQDSRSSNRHFMRVSISRMPFSILQLESRLRENFLLRHESRRCEVLERVLKLSPLLSMTPVGASPFLLSNHPVDKLL